MAKRSGRKSKASPSRKRAARAPDGGGDIPRKESIVAVDTLKSPKGRVYSILETDQADPYDEPPPTRKRRLKR